MISRSRGEVRGSTIASDRMAERGFPVGQELAEPMRALEPVEESEARFPALLRTLPTSVTRGGAGGFDALYEEALSCQASRANGQENQGP